MKLFDAFGRQAPNRVFLAILLGALAGMAYSFLIPIVLSSLGGAQVPGPGSAEPAVSTLWGVEIANDGMAGLFFFTCLLILGARSASQIMLVDVSMKLSTDMRMTVYRRIAVAPLAALENVGQARLMAVLTTDIGRILMGARLLPDLLINIVTLLGMLGFLLYLNADAFWFVMGAIAFGVVSYQVPMYFGGRQFAAARRAADDLHGAMHGLLQGAKELKLNVPKREHFFQEMLLAAERKAAGLEQRGMTITRVATSYGDLISFFVIGFITFVFVNYHAISQQELLGVIMALLYVTAPVTGILNFFPLVLMANVSLRKVNALLDELPAEEDGAAPAPAPPWRALRFSAVCYSHAPSGDSAFQVGPIDLAIERGQITFIVGGNGSGKSTLSKLLTMHYTPTAGAIHLDQTAVTAANVVACRQDISAIYTDFHLFDRLHGMDKGGQWQAQIDGYLRDLRLDQKVEVRDGRFSTLALSDGQKKRLALLVAFLEDRKLYLFDEWAADQDPEFKRVFYEKLLPDLKARDKAIVVISHDERYFHVADKLVVMEEGKIIRVDQPQRPILPAAVYPLKEAAQCVHSIPSA
jgi:putative ATP-binding cassette transporter